jgi:membrane-bound lytic murein transglycosylase D
VYYIVTNPRKFNLDICVPEKEYSWTQIEIKNQINLSQLAQFANIDIEFLKKTNSELKTLLTPPGVYSLKVLSEQAEAVQAALDNPDIKLLKNYLYTIKSGDTLFALALHYGVSVDAILNNNSGLKANTLHLGQRILIPAIKDVPEYSGNLNKTGTASATTSTPSAAQTGNQPRHEGITWQVKQGDTLWSIARYYNITVEELVRANGLTTNEKLKIGKVLRIP